MNRRFVSTCLLIFLAGSGCATAQSKAPVEGQAAVIGKVQEMFDAMEAHDTAALRNILVPEVTFFSTDERGADPTPRVTSLATFLESIGTATDVLHERMHSPVVQIDGSIATLWAPYSFHRGETFSHCGYDAFVLMRRDGKWWITAVSYTLRPAADCKQPAN